MIKLYFILKVIEIVVGCVIVLSTLLWFVISTWKDNKK